jgi:hypothetical protein
MCHTFVQHLAADGHEKSRKPFRINGFSETWW